MIQLGETKRWLKDRFNEHRRTVGNPSNISKPTTVSEQNTFLLMITPANYITFYFTRATQRQFSENICSEDDLRRLFKLLCEP